MRTWRGRTRGFSGGPVKGLTVWAALVLVSLSLGAGPPEVVRLRVPTDRVSKWFPPGTELKGMSADGFEALVRAAGSATKGEPTTPRLLRASHSARWEEGVLVGRSELIIDPPRGGAGALVLEPWTPAIDPAANGEAAVRSDGSGRTTVRVEPAPRAGDAVTAVVVWELRARPGSRGRKFALGFPREGACELALDLPEGLVPEGPSGPRRGPTRGGGRARWVFVGTPGGTDLLLTDSVDKAGHTGLWVEGPTRVDVEEASATWRLDWSVSGGPRAARNLLIALDPGLDVVTVDGTAVDDYRSAPAADGSTLLTVHLLGPLNGTGRSASRVSVRAAARAPMEGAWVVPAARPVGAVWTGGATAVRVDPSRVIESVRPLAGRRTASPPGDPTEDQRLDFVADRPAAVAEMVFRKARADVSADVRGLLVVGTTSPRLACRITWSVHKGRPHDLEVDLPRAWVADRVEIEGLDEPVTWHTEESPGGGTRAHVTSPSGDWAERSLVLSLSATSTVAGGGGPLTLPRVRPVGARLADEVWVARVESGMSLRPTRARGLAWIDPATAFVPGNGPTGLTATADAAATRPALAWRWTGDDADARVERERSDAAPRGSVGLVAAVAPDRLVLDARIAVVSHDEPGRSLIVGLTEPVADPDGWRFSDESTGQELPREPLTGAALTAATGGLGRGPAWRLELPHPQRGRVGLSAHYEGHWGGRGRIPLVVLPAPLRARCTLLVVAGRDVRTSAAAEGARALDPEMTAGSLSAEDGVAAGSATSPARRPAYAFLYDSPGARVTLTAEALAPAATGGVIREAGLTTECDPRAGPGRCRLTLRVVPDRSSSLTVTLPPGAVPERVLRDGLSVAPTRAGDAISIPLKAPGVSRPQVVVTLEYRLTRPEPDDPIVLRPQRPGFSMPCLALAWEVVLPEPWVVADWGHALTPTGPAMSRPGLLDRLTAGRARGGWGWLGLVPWAPRRDQQAAEMLREFDARLTASRGGEGSLGDWLTRLDSGRWPIVVDRDSLAAAGLGPRSRFSPPEVDDDPRTITTRDRLRSLGLCVEPVGRALLLTTRDAAPPADGAGRAAWILPLDRAAARGSDPSDRFQAVTRWLEEGAPRASASELPEPTDAREGRAVWRFHAAGWPDSGSEVRVVDRRRQSAGGWVVAVAVMLLGVATRGLPRPARAAGTAALVALGLLATAVAPSRLGGAAAGLAGGSIGLACFALGESLPGSLRRRRGQPRSTVINRRGAGSGLATPSVVALAVLAVAGARSPAQPRPALDPKAPIVALFPFDGAPDPSRTPDRVLLRLADYDRLLAAAEAAGQPPPASLEAAEARHRVGWRGDRHERLVVETDLTLAASGRGPARWTFPVDDAREIVATLDGVDVPVRVEPGARFASVAVDVDVGPDRRERTYRLSVRRTVTPRRGDWGESIGLSVNPVATARVEVDAHPSGLRARAPSARGRVVDRGGVEGPAGWLGPVSRLEIRWSPPGGEESFPSAGTVDGLYLWDALPAGDRVRARLKYHDPGGTGVVRLALDPGTLVRDYLIPGAADVGIEGSPDRPEWVARVDPPLPDGETVAVDVFRPLGDSPGTDHTRTPPRVEPLGVERSTGVLAFRHPSDWNGRVGPSDGPDAIGEETFVRLWGGTLPDDPLTLSGTVNLPPPFARAPWPEVSTGPSPQTLRVRQTVNLTLSPGRVDLALDADLTETAGPVHEIRIACPGGLHVVRVAADGLTGWALTTAPAAPTVATLGLRFEGPPLHQRKVRVEGWIAVAGDPFASGAVATSREIVVPWPRWTGQDEQPGTLSVVGSSRAALVGSSGAEAAPPDPGPSGRVSYRVTRPGELGRLRWEVDPPRVSVRALSQLTIDPESAEWVAVLLYEISNGPLDAINLKLPTEWARSASVWLDGVPHRPATETRRDPETRRETTFWSIRPGRPVWGSQRLVVRSSGPFAPGEVRSFPDLSPLGWGGAVDTSLRIANATRGPIAVEGSPGLQPVASQALAGDEEMAAPASRASSITSYHVVKSGWSLRVRKPAGPAPGEGPRADHGEVACTLAADGTVLGYGRFELGPGSGPFLAVGFDAGAAPLWASLNGSPTRLLNSGAGAWQVPLAEGSVSRVALLWRSDPPAPVPAGSTRPVSLPVVGRGRVPVVVTVRAPEGVVVTSPAGRLTPSSTERVELTKAEWLLREISATLPDLDRSSRRDGEDLVASLVRFELLLRRAGRAAFDPGATTAQREERASQAAQLARRLRERLGEAIRSEALDEFETAARLSLGLSREPAGDDAPAPSPEPPPLVRVRPLGVPHEFQGALDDASRSPALVWSPAPGPSSPDRLGPLALIGLAAVAPPLAWGLARRARLAVHAGRVALAVGLALTAFWAGPAWLVVGVGLAALGGITRAAG